MASPNLSSLLPQDSTVIPSQPARTFVMLGQRLAFPGTSILQALIFRTLLIAFLLTKGVTLELTEREVASVRSITEGTGREAAEMRNARPAAFAAEHKRCTQPASRLGGGSCAVEHGVRPEAFSWCPAQQTLAPAPFLHRSIVFWAPQESHPWGTAPLV